MDKLRTLSLLGIAVAIFGVSFGVSAYLTKPRASAPIKKIAATSTSDAAPTPTPYFTQNQFSFTASPTPAPTPQAAPKVTPIPLPVPTPTPTASQPASKPNQSESSGTGGSTYSTSGNWSGYASYNHAFTQVTGDWTVPNVSGNSQSQSDDMTWIGIGGWNSDDLIQVGTINAVSSRGNVSTSAFFELLPAPDSLVSTMTVEDGDSMSASVAEIRTDIWQITIGDITRAQTYSITVAYDSSLSSAEWIEEDPFDGSNTGQDPIDDFGSVAFTGARAAVAGSDQTLSQLGAEAIQMVDTHSNPIATPSAIGSDGQSFTVIQSTLNGPAELTGRHLHTPTARPVSPKKSNFFTWLRTFMTRLLARL